MGIYRDMPKPVLIEHAGKLSLAAVVVSGFVAVVGLADLTTQTLGLGGWAYWMVLGGMLAFLFGLYQFACHLRDLRDFNAFMAEESKATFVRSLDDVEYLAWKLPSKCEERLVEKKKQFGVK
jgi:hypothetical protein